MQPGKEKRNFTLVRQPFILYLKAAESYNRRIKKCVFNKKQNLGKRPNLNGNFKMKQRRIHIYFKNQQIP
jgi:hypothetical protein